MVERKNLTRCQCDSIISVGKDISKIEEHDNIMSDVKSTTGKKCRCKTQIIRGNRIVSEKGFFHDTISLEKK